MTKVKVKVDVQHLYSAAGQIRLLIDAVRHRQSRHSAAQARAHGLWPVATQPYVTLVCHFSGLSVTECRISTHLPTTNGRKVTGTFANTQNVTGLKAVVVVGLSATANRS